MTTAQAVAGGQGCTRKTVRCLNARDYNHELRDCCRGHVRMIMADLAELLTSVGATWWADYGTLLGAVRNPTTTWADYPWLSQDGRDTPGPAAGIVPHDKDGDLGVMWADWARVRALRTRLERRGYAVWLNGGRGSAKVMLSAKNHTNVDLFFWRERPTGVLFRNGYADVDRYKGREFHKSALHPMTSVQWEGLTLPAPKDPEAFLAMRYGPGWRIPIAANNDGVAR